MASIISLNFIFFWDSTKDPFNDKIPKWLPYPEEECRKITPFFLDYINFSVTERISKDENFWLDFYSGFQVSKKNEYCKRPLLVTWKKLTPFIWLGIDVVQFRIPVKLDFFRGIFEQNGPIFITLLREEISWIRKNKYPHLKYEYGDYLDLIEISPTLFFENVIKMYTSTYANNLKLKLNHGNYLKRELDEILWRFGEDEDNKIENDNGFDRIKHFYLALMASVNFFRLQTEKEIKNIIDSEKMDIKHIIGSEGKDMKIIVYYYRELNQQEAEKFKEKQDGIIFFLHEFIMGSFELEKAKMLAKYSQNRKNKFIFELELPVESNGGVNFTYLGLENLKQNLDDEILIHSGGVFKVIEVNECKGDNLFDYTLVRAAMSKLK